MMWLQGWVLQLVIITIRAQFDRGEIRSWN